MKIVIVGAGSVGVQLARQLVSENKDVVLIERDREIADRVQSALDCLVVHGEGTNREVLRNAGTETADFFIAATTSDEVNMIACGIVSSEFAVKAKIARVRSINYHASQLPEKRFLGIDFVVNPEVEAARAIMRAVDFGAVSDIMAFEQSKVQIRSIVVDRDGPLAGRSLAQLSQVLPGSFLVGVIIRENRYIIPRGDTTLAISDILYLVATEGDFEAIFDALGKGPRALRRVVLIGGGRIGRQVAEHLQSDQPQTLFQRVARRLKGKHDRELKIIERDRDRCKDLSEQFPNALVIEGDISDDDLFEDQPIGQVDLVIAATDNQELNMITALYAKKLGAQRSVVLVNRASYVSVAAQLGIDVPVSQKSAVVTSILRFIRSGAVRSLHSISDGRIEALELTVRSESRAVGKAIRDLSLPKDTLIVALERDGQSLVPGGSNVIRVHDHLVVVAKKEHGERVQEYFGQ